jgi:RHS repeat-associated protein
MATKHTTRLRLALIMVLFIAGFANTAKATHEIGTTRLSGPAASVSAVLFIQDNKYDDIAAMPGMNTWGFYDKSFRNKLTLGVNRYSTVALADYVATVTLQVTSTAPLALGGAMTVLTKTLSISYEGKNDHQSSAPHLSIDQDVCTFNDGYRVATKIMAIAVTSSDPALNGSVMPANAYLESEIDADRYYPLRVNAAPYTTNKDVMIYYIPASDEFEICWKRIHGAEEYDLEWLWLDGAKNSYWTNQPQIDFRNNSTRVRTSQQSYRVSNIFEKGQLCVRLRGVGRTSSIPNAWEKMSYTPWSWQDKTTLLSTGLPAGDTYTSTPAPTTGTDFLFYVTIDGLTAIQTSASGTSQVPPVHEADKNWQYQATYAEEGKKKEVISYFDGSLRGRQMVTRINSDNNAIVGESYYDYNGRAVVQALPVPVENATIKFYQYNVSGQLGFNFDDITHKPYTKKFFDEESSAGTNTTCVASAAGLDPAYGSSRYYSGNNLNQQFAQGYVPDAEKLPISQTVFTNDNTGRIAAQGGVGKTYQIGNGHETKYFYGSPEQIELDRLFGSEVGYNQHYQKNMVVDANGQVSVSYLDQQGRVIATALSAQGPANLSPLTDGEGNPLYPAPTASNVISADLLNKVNPGDVDTELDNNRLIGTELSFGKKILVPAAATYTISYDLKGTSFTYSCLPANVCYDCIYDLEINIVDNCQNNPPGFTKITHTLGHIIPPADENASATTAYTLDLNCNDEVHFSTSQLSYSGSDLLVNLQQGEYTMTKTLKVNQEALSYYLAEYLKSDCVKQRDDFAAFSVPDTSGCNLTCDACVAALGSLTSYTASGKGTAEDWQREYDICREPCEYVSLCDASYITMLADVSPGGQYGDWEDEQGNCNPALYSLSVYNGANRLPKIKNFTIGTRIPTWENPFFRNSVQAGNSLSDFTAKYFDDNGQESKVLVTKMSSGPDVYFPAVKAAVTPTAVGAGTGVGEQYYVRPQQLANVSDFISNWQNSWAKSLVFYHPEYPYYDWCLKNSTNTVTPYAVTTGTGTAATTSTISCSDDYDALLLETDDVLGLGTGDLNSLCLPLTNDPYWSANGVYYDYANTTNDSYPVTAVGTTCPQKTGGMMYTALSYPWRPMFPSIDHRYTNYQGSGTGLPAFAALITTSCAIQYGQPMSSQLACLGAMLSPTMSASAVSTAGAQTIVAGLPVNLRNAYWNRFKTMYLSLKQEMQMEAAESYAMNGDYRGVNNGIGDPAFDPQSMTVPFTKYIAFDFSFSIFDIFRQWYYPFAPANYPQYSTPFTQSLYANKIKRFPDANSATSLANSLPNGDPGANIYASTGLCPNAFYFQNFLNTLATGDELTASILNLSTIPEFNPDLYKVVAGGVVPASFTPANWTASNTSNDLTAAIQTGTNAACGLSLNFPTGYPFNFSNTGNGGTYAFLNLYQLVPGTVSGGNYNFTVKADVALASGASQTFTTVTLSGSTCIPLTGCSFTPPCEPTPSAVALQKLMNAIAATGNMCTSSVAMNDVNIQPYFVNSFGVLLGSGTWEWQVNGLVPNFKIVNTSGSIVNTNSMTISFASSPCAPGSQFNFSHINGSNSASNVFNAVLNTITTSGSTITTATTVATGTVSLNGAPLTMGNCSFDLSACNTNEHHVKKDLETFLSDPNTPGRLQATSFSLTPVQSFSSHLRDQLADSYQTYNSGTQATDPLFYYWKRNAVSTATLLTGAFMASTLTTVPSTLQASACSFSLSFADPSSLSGQSLLSSSYALSNFVLAPGPLINASVRDFSVTATFGSTPFVLNGSSACFGMRSCEGECETLPVGPPSVATCSVLVNDFNCSGNGAFTVTDHATTFSTTANVTANPTTCSDPENINQGYYGISDSVALSGFGNYPGYGNGSSLFINPGKLYQGSGNNYSVYSQGVRTECATCNQFYLRFVASGKIAFTCSPSGNYSEAQLFMASINGVNPANTYTVPTSSPGWVEYILGPFTNNPLATNFINIQTAPVTVPGGCVANEYVGLDNITLSFQCGAPSLPCVNVNTVTLTPFPEVEYEDPCVQYALDAAENEGDELFNAYIDSAKSAFIQAYVKKCIGSAVETFYMKYNNGDYQFTLYYYDQAGNLVRTVPPQGVSVITNGASLAAINSERAAKTPYGSKTVYTNHTLATTYTYNSLNQLVKQATPDGGTSQFWYDVLGRIVASQTARQQAASSAGNNIYSYSHYDYLGRVAQAGEMTISQNLAAMTTTDVAAIASVSNYPDNLTLVRREVTTSHYGDDPAFTPLVAGTAFSAGSQENLRTRIAAVTFEDVDDNSVSTYNHATHYSYDVHGKVQELIQENKDITLFTYQQLKKMGYSYDLVSGKVNEVAYQKGLADMFLHRYEYDADNRITAVYTSKDDVLWERDAKYFYYLHGPLARVETGHDKVQGTDYAYTLHGWIKGVNSNILKEMNDIGKDGNGSLTASTSGTPFVANKFNGRDVYGYSLTYFNNSTQKDYTGINGFSGGSADFVAAAPSVQTPDLYNGNIRQMTSSYLDASAPAKSYGLKALLRNFTYDQLNRIETATSNDNLGAVTNSWGAAIAATYSESFSYDQNGNIRKSKRNGDQPGSLAMDDLAYNYIAGSNKLAYVVDAVTGDPYSSDIGTQSTGNYDYDASGNLIKDNAEGISQIDWTVSGKVKGITFNNGKPNLLFRYDAMGHRISKTVYDGATVTNTANIIYYVMDATGNVMATYEQTPGMTKTPNFNLKERQIYGSSRLGLNNQELILNTYTNTPINTVSVNRTLGYRSYELINHLGNVMAVVSDRKIAVDGNSDGTADYFTGEVLNANDYYAFGAQMPGRNFTTEAYRYGYQGFEMDDEIKGEGNSIDFGARIYDSRLGRWFSIDGYASSYPHQSPYGFVGNSPILNQEIDGNYYDVSSLSKEARNGTKRAYQKQLGKKEALKLMVVNDENLVFQHPLRAKLWMGLHPKSANATLVKEIVSDKNELTIKENANYQGVTVNVTTPGDFKVVPNAPIVPDGYTVPTDNPTTVVADPSIVSTESMPIEAEFSVKDKTLTLNRADIKVSESSKQTHSNDVFYETVQQATALIQNLKKVTTLPAGDVKQIDLKNHYKSTDNNAYYEKDSKVKTTKP